MPIRIFTLAFSEETQTFHDDLIQQFCVNKRIHRIVTKFFTRLDQPFWTVAIHYGVILSEEKGLVREQEKREVYPFDEQQKVLYTRLAEWRKETAESAGIPAYMICTNKQLAQMIFQQCVSLESLKMIRGFGAARIEKHGKGLTAIIKTFYKSDG
jgi:superfamily II DNA helicase RecQ